jgi:hypothetical protein
LLVQLQMPAEQVPVLPALVEQLAPAEQGGTH